MAVRAERRALLRLDADTALSQADCLALVVDVAKEAKAGLNYVGQGLEYDVSGMDGWALIEMTSKRGKVCDFGATVEPVDGKTKLRIGGLDDFQVMKTYWLFIPTGTEILGYGFYKQFLREVKAALVAADPTAAVHVAVPSV